MQHSGVTCAGNHGEGNGYERLPAHAFFSFLCSSFLFMPRVTFHSFSLFFLFFSISSRLPAAAPLPAVLCSPAAPPPPPPPPFYAEPCQAKSSSLLRLLRGNLELRSQLDASRRDKSAKFFVSRGRGARTPILARRRSSGGPPRQPAGPGWGLHPLPLLLHLTSHLDENDSSVVRNLNPAC